MSVAQLRVLKEYRSGRFPQPLMIAGLMTAHPSVVTVKASVRAEHGRRRNKPS